MVDRAIGGVAAGGELGAESDSASAGVLAASSANTRDCQKLSRNVLQGHEA